MEQAQVSKNALVNDGPVEAEMWDSSIIELIEGVKQKQKKFGFFSNITLVHWSFAAELSRGKTNINPISTCLAKRPRYASFQLRADSSSPRSAHLIKPVTFLFTQCFKKRSFKIPHFKLRLLLHILNGYSFRYLLTVFENPQKSLIQHSERKPAPLTKVR